MLQALPWELGMQDLLVILGAALMAGFVGWLFWSERRRTRLLIAPAAAELTRAELREALRILAYSGGRIAYEDDACPLPEAVSYRAQNEGWITLGNANDAPSASGMWVELTEDGWTFLGHEPPGGRRQPISGASEAAMVGTR